MNETALWAAVLSRAIEDLSDKNARIVESAKYWFAKNTGTGIGSFNWVCGALGYNPDKIRERVIANEVYKSMSKLPDSSQRRQ